MVSPRYRRVVGTGRIEIPGNAGLEMITQGGMLMFHRGSLQLRAARSRSAGHQPLVSAHKPLQDLTLDVAAALLLACSVTMATDFSRRILAANPDELGIASIAVQAAFSVAATSTFTKAGWQWVDTLRSNLRIKPLSKSRLRFSLALLLFLITFPTWIWVPDRLAVIYNDQGERLSTRSQIRKRCVTCRGRQP